LLTSELKFNQKALSETQAFLKALETVTMIKMSTHEELVFLNILTSIFQKDIVQKLLIQRALKNSVSKIMEESGF
jgi:DNA-binding protein YbaB